MIDIRMTVKLLSEGREKIKKDVTTYVVAGKNIYHTLLSTHTSKQNMMGNSQSELKRLEMGQ